MCLGESDEIVNIGLDGLHPALHRGNRIAPAGLAHADTPLRAKVLIRQARRPARLLPNTNISSDSRVLI